MERKEEDPLKIRRGRSNAKKNKKKKIKTRRKSG